MSRIRVLADSVVNQIAAGEVVERPASVVKELVENAVDASASQVDILLKAGGKDRIRVSDDGLGMERDDALMCLERHATSKIRQADDLVGVGSLGFRGEAIPSIASVSKLTIDTCPRDAEAGVRVVVEGGELKTARAHGCPPGTVMDVRQLFFNTPARRKFLRTTATELSHCTEAVVRQALGRPDVGFRLQHDGRVVFSAEAGEGSRRVRDILGRDADRMLDVTIEHPAVTGSGFVSPLSVQRPAGKALYAYVNGRYVSDGLIRRAIADAYRDRVPRGRHPLVVLHLQVPAGDVDVNVHPAKTEVRFRQPQQVQSGITAGLRAALDAEQIRPQRQARQPRYVESAPVLPLGSRSPAPSPHPDDDPALRLAAPVLQRVQEIPAQPRESTPMAPPTAPVQQPAPEPPVPVSSFPASALLAADAPSTARTLRAIGPFGRRWLLCEGDDALVIVDHVLADVLLTERRLRRDGRAQRLLVPHRERLPPGAVEQLEAHAGELAGLGLEIAVLSPTELLLRTVPAAVKRLHTDGILAKLAQQQPDAWARVLAESQTLPEPPDARTLKAMLASLEEAGLDAVVRAIPTSELVKRR